MNTIKKLSSNGFLLEDGWHTVDSKIIKSKTFKFPFENLKIGDRIDSIKVKIVNDKEYVTDFIVLDHKDSVRVEAPPNLLTHQNSNSASPSDKAHEILKGQCLNIVFNSYFRERNIEFSKEERLKAIQLSQKLLIELEDADYYKW